VLSEMRRSFNASIACIAFHARNPASSCAISTNPDAAASCAQFYDKGIDSEWLQALKLAPLTRVYRDHAVIGFECLRKSALWNEWMAPLDMYGSLTCKLSADDEGVWLFDMQRGRNQEQFSTEDEELVQDLVHRIVAAEQIKRRNTLLRSAVALDNFPLAFAVTDGRGRIEMLNAAAQAIVNEHPTLLSVVSNCLVATEARFAAKLQKLMADACDDSREFPTSGGITLWYANHNVESPGLAALAVTVLPLGGKPTYGASGKSLAAIFMRRISSNLPSGFAEQIMSIFALTPVEARLATALASGHSLREAASFSNIEFSTARRYLERIFRKTRAHHQGQLIAILRNIYQ